MFGGFQQQRGDDCVYSAGITGDVVMDADADRVTPYVFWQLSPDDDQYIDVLKVLTSNEPGQVRSAGPST